MVINHLQVLGWSSKQEGGKTTLPPWCFGTSKDRIDAMKSKDSACATNDGWVNQPVDLNRNPPPSSPEIAGR